MAQLQTKEHHESNSFLSARTIPLDDEPVSDAEYADIAEAQGAYKRGETVSNEEFKQLLGFA